MTDNEGPPWFRVMFQGDLGRLAEELRKLPNIDKAWYAVPGWCTYNPLGWAAFMFHYDLMIMQCVLDAGANPNACCRYFGCIVPILQYLEVDFDYLHDFDDALDIAQVLIKNGACCEGTMFESFAKQHHENNYAVCWCFAKVMPAGSRDIAFDFLKRFEELSWGDVAREAKRLKTNENPF